MFLVFGKTENGRFFFLFFFLFFCFRKKGVGCFLLFFGFRKIMKIHSGALLRSIVFNCGRFSLSKHVWSMVEYVLKAFGALKDRNRLAQCLPVFTRAALGEWETWLASRFWQNRKITGLFVVFFCCFFRFRKNVLVFLLLLFFLPGKTRKHCQVFLLRYIISNFGLTVSQTVVGFHFKTCFEHCWSISGTLS